jgi:hypothetical protein
MMIIDPVALGDVACTRASVKYVYDRTGTLVQVPANTLAVTYDPRDLSKAPYALVEPVATNLFPESDSIGNWSLNGAATKAYDAAYAPNGTQLADLVAAGVDAGIYRVVYGLTAGATYTASFFVEFSSIGPGAVLRWGSDSFLSDRDAMTAWFDAATGAVTFEGAAVVSAEARPWGKNRYRLFLTFQNKMTDSVAFIAYTHIAALTFSAWGFMLVVGEDRSSFIGSGLTRAADVIATGGGLVYSNVAITETPYSAATTYASGAQVYDPATYAMYQSLVAANVGNALTDTSKWAPLASTVVNRWRMFDQYNNTQTTNAEEIIVCVSPQAISQGLYLGNVDASEVRLSVVDLTEGLVYQETQSLIVSNSGSSFYNWGFKPIRRRSYMVSVTSPPYANALITIAIKKPGGTPKCGVCAIGPLVDVGLSQYGIGREIKDYSTINFNFDGTTNLQKRNFAKRMDIDVVIDNEQIDYVIEALEGYRQKPVAWIGAKELGSACLFGRYSSFKNVVENFPESKMNLQIEGTV